MYRLVFALVLRHLDPERAHHLGFLAIRILGAPGIRALVTRLLRPDPRQAVTALGLNFSTPFGIAAGFDKNATAVSGVGALGFGHIEVGTVTARPQPGNDRPRLFRLVADRALINRMGFNNDGADQVARRLRALRRRHRRPVIGVNIGKTRVVAVEDAVGDYATSAAVLAPLADYLVVNVSSPNTPGLRGLQELDLLEPLLTEVQRIAASTPLLVKIAPDLTDDQVERIAGLVVRLGLDGIVATNTTIARDGLRASPRTIDAAGAGGLSGPPVALRSLEILRLLRRVVDPGLCIISVGGVETAEDVAERLAAGATLVQGYTGFIYRGPLWARQIDRGLAR